MNRSAPARKPQSTAYSIPIAQQPTPTTIPIAVFIEAKMVRYLLIRWPTSVVVRVVRLIFPWPKSWMIRLLMSSRLIMRKRSRIRTMNAVSRPER